jgi:hypothetical protein
MQETNKKHTKKLGRKTVMKKVLNAKSTQSSKPYYASISIMQCENAMHSKRPRPLHSENERLANPMKLASRWLPQLELFGYFVIFNMVTCNVKKLKP